AGGTRVGRSPPPSPRVRRVPGRTSDAHSRTGTPGPASAARNHGPAALQVLLDKVRRTPDNAAFPRKVLPTVPDA
ncbi:hypothetical protein ACFWR2_33365, partial [Streptomyces californicus]